MYSIQFHGFFSRSLFLTLAFAFSSQGFSQYKSPRINNSNLPGYASVFDLQTTAPLRLLQDNVESFQEKLTLIRNAKSTLDIAYYIYSDDESSSYFSQELIKAAHRGVKIRVLLDYIANYKLLDTLIAIQNEAKKTGAGSIEFRLYGRPTANIIRDAIYMTTPCDGLTYKQCLNHKSTMANKLINPELVRKASELEKDQFHKRARNANSGLSGVFLSAVYGKSGNTLKFLFHLLGYDKKLSEAAQSKKALTPEEKQEAKKLIETYFQSKNGNLRSSLLLGIASLFYGEQVDEMIKLLNETLPAQLPALDENRVKDWDYFTDYLHHKLLLADTSTGYEAILGGRNIENSYHMQKSPNGKYTFVDTDITVPVDHSSGQKLQGTFDRLWNFTPMVASIGEVLQHAPNDTQVILSNCETLNEKCLMGVPKTPDAIQASRAQRYSKALKALYQSANDFLSPKNQAYNTLQKSSSIYLDRSKDPQSRISYVENLPFNKNKKKLVRNYGSQVDFEELSGKYIHKIWANALLDLCGPKNGPQTVYLHSAYVVLPTPLLAAIAEMTKSASPATVLKAPEYTKTDCSNVTIKIITNSPETTDLSVINVFARVQLHALLKSIEEVKQDSQYQAHHLARKAAQIEYYEYLSLSHKKSVSLHTKISILGDNAIVGSANADVRSYMMDSNNGVYIENAPHFTSQYAQFIEKELRDPSILRRLDLQWRQGVLSPDKNYIGNEVSILIKRIQLLLKDRTWANEKYFQTLERIFYSVFMEDVLTKTVKASSAYTNIHPEDIGNLQRIINGITESTNNRPMDVNAVHSELRKDKNNIDHLLKIF